MQCKRGPPASQHSAHIKPSTDSKPPDVGVRPRPRRGVLSPIIGTVGRTARTSARRFETNDSVHRSAPNSPTRTDMRLLLFDIDGTLVRVRSAARTALVRAVERVTGHTVSVEGVSFSGRTDPQIFSEVLRRNKLPTRTDILNDVLTSYSDLARKGIQSAHVEQLPGAPDLVSTLADHDHVRLGLVTGNVQSIAVHKLRMAGLADFFPTGAFGDDHADRAHLPRLAILRASLHARTPIDPEDTIVIGDTIHDINCARSAGSQAVAVSTGTPASSTLASHGPDLLLDTLQAPNLPTRLLEL